MLANQLKITGGQWRGRVIHFASQAELRPTGARIRETLFNWLQFELAQKQCLDLFAGSGILSFEALSRGAASVVALDRDKAQVANILKQKSALRAQNLTVLCADVLNYLTQQCPEPYDVVFLDPPYSAQLLGPIAHLLLDYGWLKPNAWIFYEHHQALKTSVWPESWCLKRSKKAGQVHYGLLQNSGVL